MTTGKVTPVGKPTPKYKPMVLELPIEKSKIETDISKFSFFIYGIQKIGKTTFTAQFPDTIHLMFEPGAKTEEIYQVAPTSWKEVIEFVRLINAGDRFKNVVIDTVDLLFDMCARDLCIEKGVDKLGDIGFGDGYNECAKRFRQVLIDIQSQRGLICLAHNKEKMKINDNAAEYTVPSTMATGAKTIAKWIDLTGHYYLHTNKKRYLRIRPSNDMEAGTRIKKHFMYTDGSPIYDIPMGSSEEEAYKNFVDAFNNKLENTNKKPTTKTKFVIPKQ